MTLVQLFTVSFTKMHACHLECFPFFKKKKSICRASLPLRFPAASFPSLSFLSLFSLEPLCVPPSCFSDKAPFIPFLSGAHLLTLLSITQPAVRRHWWLWAAPLCLWSLMWPAADVHSPQGEESMWQPCIHSGGVEGEDSYPPAGFIKTPGHPPWGYTVWSPWNG